jgi:hypothetical protein
MNIERLKYILANQERRNFDRFILGPMLLFIGVKYKRLPKKARRLLVGAGVWQLLYNYKDYIKLQEDATNLLIKKDDSNV